MATNLRTQGIRLAEGRVLADRTPGEVSDFLRGRDLVDFRCAPCELEVVTEGRELFLVHRNGDRTPRRMRRAFFGKLLNWYGIPLYPLILMGES